MEIEKSIEIQRVPEFALPQTIEQLDEFCDKRKFISKNVRLCYGQRKQGVENLKKGRVAGDFGLELTYGHQVIATSGFELLINKDGQKFLRITHSPQGIKHNQISSRALGKLRNHDFRGRIVQKYLPIAQAMGQEYIQGISAENHPKVKRTDVSLERGKTIMDEVYERCGYTQGEDNNYYLSLAQA